MAYLLIKHPHKNKVVYEITNQEIEEMCYKDEVNIEIQLPTKSKQPVDKKVEENNKQNHSKKYTNADVDLLARLITAEMGASWAPDKMQLYVGSVVLNRMAHSSFPNTLRGVIYQKGQYSPTWTGGINNKPDERTINNARKLLENGSILPANVVFQANFKQGDGVYHKYYDKKLGTTTYFCYISNE